MTQETCLIPPSAFSTVTSPTTLLDLALSAARSSRFSGMTSARVSRRPNGSALLAYLRQHRGDRVIARRVYRASDMSAYAGCTRTDWTESSQSETPRQRHRS